MVSSLAKYFWFTGSGVTARVDRKPLASEDVWMVDLHVFLLKICSSVSFYNVLAVDLQL
jgi:hypothetical protein